MAQAQAYAYAFSITTVCTGTNIENVMKETKNAYLLVDRHLA
jgi:hypothetical protein